MDRFKEAQRYMLELEHLITEKSDEARIEIVCFKIKFLLSKIIEDEIKNIHTSMDIPSEVVETRPLMITQWGTCHTSTDPKDCESIEDYRIMI